VFLNIAGSRVEVTVCWDVTPCAIVDKQQRLEERRVRLWYFDRSTKLHGGTAKITDLHSSVSIWSSTQTKTVPRGFRGKESRSVCGHCARKKTRKFLSHDFIHRCHPITRI